MKKMMLALVAAMAMGCVSASDDAQPTTPSVHAYREDVRSIRLAPIQTHGKGDDIYDEMRSVVSENAPLYLRALSTVFNAVSSVSSNS